jgi:hypothetical protein
VGDPTPRASDAEREATAQRLRDAAAEGRLDFEELTDRLGRAYDARARAELEPLTADLPAAAPAPAAARRWFVGIFGGEDRRGRWRAAPRMTVVNVFGGSDLDLRRAEVEGDRIEITVFSLFGGSKIRVPEGVRVEMSGFALFGGSNLDAGDRPAAPGAPVLHVRAFSLFGGTEVTARGERRDRPGHLPRLH